MISLNPGASVTLLADALDATPASVRWAVVQARQWLGYGPDDKLLLPPGYTGYHLSPWVTCDLVELLAQPAAAVLSDGDLLRLLRLSRGPVLAGEPAGSWRWAEELRIGAAEQVRDIAHELVGRCLAAGDLSTARWAAGRGLSAVPADELLMGDRLRTEVVAGAVGEARRLAAQIRLQAERLAVAPLPETEHVLTEADRLAASPV